MPDWGVIIGESLAKAITAALVYVDSIGVGRGKTATKQVARAATGGAPPAAPNVGPICSIYDPEWEAMIGSEL